MLPWELLDSAAVPGGKAELRLYRRGMEFSIRLDRCELMNSRLHGSEEALAEMACARVADCGGAHVLVGGLGMGFTVSAALRRLGADARVVVAELSSAVIGWNHGPLADLAGRPLDDSRVTVREADVAQVLRAERAAFDTILLDVDNGPEGLTRKSNDWLYSQAGLGAAFRSLRPEGVLGVWSSTSDQEFTRRLYDTGFTVEESQVRSRGRKGPRHTIWIGQRGK